MPENDQFTTGVLVSNSTGDSVVFMQRNDTTNTWAYLYEAPFPPGARGGPLDFCKDGLLASAGTTAKGPAVFLFSRGRSGRFESADTIESPDNQAFSGAVAWDGDRCWVLAVGGQSKLYIYQTATMMAMQRIGVQYEQVAIIATVFVAGMFIAVVVVAIVYLVLRFRRRRHNRLNADGRDVNLL
jgi:hypothetical protein